MTDEAFGPLDPLVQDHFRQERWVVVTGNSVASCCVSASVWKRLVWPVFFAAAIGNWLGCRNLSFGGQAPGGSLQSFVGVKALEVSPAGNYILVWDLAETQGDINNVTYEVYMDKWASLPTGVVPSAQALDGSSSTDVVISSAFATMSDVAAPVTTGVLLQSVKGTQSYTLTEPLDASSIYAFQVRALDQFGNSDDNRRVLIYDPSKNTLTFGGATSLRMTENNSLLLSWEAPTSKIDMTKIVYNVYMGVSSQPASAIVAAGSSTLALDSSGTSSGASTNTSTASLAGSPIGSRIAMPPETAPSASGAPIAQVTGQTLYIVTQSLDPSLTYLFQVQAQGPGGQVGASDEVIVYQLPQITFAGLTSATTMSDSKILLEWNPGSSSDIQQYKIYAASDLTTPVASTTSTSYIMTGLTAGTMYSYVVRAENSSGMIDHNTVQKSATTLPYAVPNFNGIATATQLSGVAALTGIKLGWQMAGGDVTGYRVYMSTTSGGEDFTQPVAVVGATTSNAAAGPYIGGVGTTSATVGGLTPGTTYYFVVRAFYFDGTNVLTEVNTIEKSESTLPVSASFPAPTVISIVPAAGPLLGGGSVTITGANFITGASATVGGKACTGVQVQSPTSLTCTLAASTSGPADVVVTNPTTQSGSLTGAYYYTSLSAPTLTSLSPTSGPPSGGTSMTITGTGFAANPIVTIGGATCASVTVVSSTSITCTTASHTAGPADVTVVNFDHQGATLAAAFTYQAAPSVTSVSPRVGPTSGGTTLAVNGGSFLDGAIVSVGGAPCTSVAVVSPSQLTCLTGASGSGTVGVVVTNPDSQTGSLASAFIYTSNPAPSVSSLVPAAGYTGGGTAVTINGSGFESGIAVTLGGVTCTGLSVVSSSKLTCTAGTHAAAAVNVVAANTDTQSATLNNGYTYTTAAAPRVSGISPAVGPLGGGTAVTISGSGFANGASVTVGGVGCTSVNVVSFSQITCTTGAHASGWTTVQVTNADTQFGSLGSAFDYTSALAPAVASVSPTYGNPSGGTTLAVNGSNFAAGVSVYVGGNSCAPVSLLSGSRLTCQIPAGSVGAADVMVVNADTQSGTLPQGYTYLGPITATSILPSAGPLNGGETLNISGSGFVTGVSVTIGSNSCPVTAVTPTSVSCTGGAAAAGSYSAVVTNPDGETATITNGFTYEPGPYVFNIAPTSGGSTGGGTTITINGLNFLPGASVTVDGTPCASTTLVSSREISCVTPAHATGTVDVAVANADNQSWNYAASFTYGTYALTRVDLVAGVMSPYGYAGGAGTAVRFRQPQGIVSDGTYLYVADQGNHLIRRVEIATGTVSDFAGSESISDCVDGVGTSARLQTPWGMVIDSTNTYIYFSDCNAIRKLTIATGDVTTVAGGIGGQNGYSDGTGSVALFSGLRGLTSDGSNLYVADANNQLIRKVVIGTWAVTTLAGSPGTYGYQDGTGTGAIFWNPGSVATDGTYVYVGEESNSVIRRVTISSGTVTTVAGVSGVTGTSDGTGTSALFDNNIGGLVLDSSNANLYIAATGNQTIRRLATATGQVTTLTTGGGSVDGSVNGSGKTYGPDSLYLSGGTLYFADENSDNVRSLDLTSNTLTTIGGPGQPYGFQDGTGPSALFSNVGSMIPDATGAYLFVLDTDNCALRKLAITTGQVSTVFGGQSGYVDGPAVSAKMSSPIAMTTDGTNLYIFDRGNLAIRVFNLATEAISTLAGGNGSGEIDGGPSTAQFSDTWGITTDGISLYTAEYNTCTIRRTDIATGVVSTIAGSAGNCIGTDGTGSAARFYNPQGMATDGTNIFIADVNDHAIRKLVPSTGTVTTLAGSLVQGGQVQGVGTAARFYNPLDLASDGTFLYLMDNGSHILNRIDIATGAVTWITQNSNYGDFDGPLSSAMFFVGSPSLLYTNSQIYVGNQYNIRHVH